MQTIHTEAESRREWLIQTFQHFGARQDRQKHQIWRHGNYPIPLWSMPVIKQKLDYVHQNPVKAGLVDEPLMWRYSSAANYAGLPGITEVELLEVW